MYRQEVSGEGNTGMEWPPVQGAKQVSMGTELFAKYGQCSSDILFDAKHE